MTSIIWLIAVFLLASNWPLSPCSITTSALRLSGTINPGKVFFSFLAKFGFQKTEILNKDATQGYIYGNITYHHGASNQTNAVESSDQVTLAVLDRANFLEYYGNRSVSNRKLACQKMFKKINQVAYHATCHDEGEQDFLRAVPCPEGSVCLEEDVPDNVVKGSQFTFRIRDLYQARFWYISIVACRLNASTCQWEYVSEFPANGNGNIQYDIQLVNGNPMHSHKNIFKYQFSSDKQDLLQVYLGLLLLYTILMPLQMYASKKQNHAISRLLAAGLTTQFAALFLICIHYSLFAANGAGIAIFAVIGEVLEIISDSLFMLLLLLLAMGWAITRQELSCKITLFSLWSAYTLLSILLYVWMKTEVDVIEDVEEYQTVPGIITVIMRIIVMICFVAALRDTMAHEFNSEKLNFFLHFGAASLVWFNYLPILSLVALQISALWREKFLSGVSYSVDSFGYAVLMHLLWPGRSQQYFILAAGQTDHTEELEELCHAPNHINESGGESGGEYWLSHAHAQNGLSHPVSAQDQDINKAGADMEPSEETTNHAVIVDNIVVI